MSRVLPTSFSEGGAVSDRPVASRKPPKATMPSRRWRVGSAEKNAAPTWMFRVGPGPSSGDAAHSVCRSHPDLGGHCLGFNAARLRDLEPMAIACATSCSKAEGKYVGSWQDDKCACKLVHEEQQAGHVGLESRLVVRALAETVSRMLPGRRVPCELAA